METCISCDKPLMNDEGSVKFKCPSCNEYMIKRCSSCRKIAAEYKCPNCGFQGP
ncbi:MAG: zinc finger domain-containing protein [Candidatus Woesearchaeota archaeon]